MGYEPKGEALWCISISLEHNLIEMIVLYKQYRVSCDSHLIDMCDIVNNLSKPDTKKTKVMSQKI